MSGDQEWDRDGVDLHDDENEIVEAQTHDPKNAEAQSIASVAAADDKVKKAPSRKGDKSNSEPMQKMPKSKPGLINAMYNMMNGMDRSSLMAMYSKMGESVDFTEEEVMAEDRQVEGDYDFSADLNALVNSEATLSEEFKEKTAIIFEAAIKSKLAEEIDRLEETYKQELAEEVSTMKSEMVEKVDSYLNYVVETWMEENQVAIQSGLRTDIAETFMNKLKNLFEESYVEVPESKVDLVDDLAEQVEELEEQLNKTTANAIAIAEELEVYKRESIIREASRDLAETQVERLKSLVENVDFDNEETFAKKVSTIKESYFSTKSTAQSWIEEEDEDGDTSVEVSDTMSQYLSAIRKTSQK